MPAKTAAKHTLPILIDTREQRPFAFSDIAPANPRTIVTVNTAALPEGDYALACPPETPREDRIVIERKSLADLYSSVTAGRDRFEQEFARLSEYGHAALVIEADLSAIMDPNAHLRHATEAVPKAIVATLVAWSQRYGVAVWPCPNRDFAEKLTFRMLERWARDHQ